MLRTFIILVGLLFATTAKAEGQIEFNLRLYKQYCGNGKYPGTCHAFFDTLMKGFARAAENNRLPKPYNACFVAQRERMNETEEKYKLLDEVTYLAHRPEFSDDTDLTLFLMALIFNRYCSNGA